MVLSCGNDHKQTKYEGNNKNFLDDFYGRHPGFQETNAGHIKQHSLCCTHAYVPSFNLKWLFKAIGTSLSFSLLNPDRPTLNHPAVLS